MNCTSAPAAREGVEDALHDTVHDIGGQRQQRQARDHGGDRPDPLLRQQLRQTRSVPLDDAGGRRSATAGMPKVPVHARSGPAGGPECPAASSAFVTSPVPAPQLDHMALAARAPPRRSRAPWPGRAAGHSARRRPSKRDCAAQRFRKSVVPARESRPVRDSIGGHVETLTDAFPSRQEKAAASLLRRLHGWCGGDSPGAAASNTGSACRICSSALTMDTYTAAAKGSDCTIMNTAHSRASGSDDTVAEPQNRRLRSTGARPGSPHPRAMPSAMPSVARSSIFGVRMNGRRLVARP